MPLLPSQRIELAIYRYVCQVGAERSVTVGSLALAVQADSGLVVERLKHLNTEGYIKLSKYLTKAWIETQSKPQLKNHMRRLIDTRVSYSEGQSFWTTPGNFFSIGDFVVEITPRGRAYFESFDIQERAAQPEGLVMPSEPKFDLRGPYPKTLQKVYEELDYWASRQNEGVPTSVHEEGVKNRMEHLRDLERRFLDQHRGPDSNVIFISCGQYTAAEKKLGHNVLALVRELTPYDPYFADVQSSLEGLTDNILSRLHQCVGFISIIHPRGDVTFPGGSKHTRGSVWIEQEIAIAAFITQVLKRPIRALAFIHQSIKREGMREQLHLNPVLFGEDHEVLDRLRTELPNWRDLSESARR